MTALDIYSKAQVDALIAGAGGGITRVARSDWAALSSSADKDVLLVMFIEQRSYVFFINKENYAMPIYVDHYYVMGADPIRDNTFSFYLSDILENWSASSTKTLSVTPLKAIVSGTDVVWTVETDRVPRSYTMELDPSGTFGSNAVFVYTV